MDNQKKIIGLSIFTSILYVFIIVAYVLLFNNGKGFQKTAILDNSTSISILIIIMTLFLLGYFFMICTSDKDKGKLSYTNIKKTLENEKVNKKDILNILNLLKSEVNQYNRLSLGSFIIFLLTSGVIKYSGASLIDNIDIQIIFIVITTFMTSLFLYKRMFYEQISNNVFLKYTEKLSSN